MAASAISANTPLIVVQAQLQAQAFAKPAMKRARAHPVQVPGLTSQEVPQMPRRRRC
jgi:hypothetical protein